MKALYDSIILGLAYMDKFRNESGAYSTWPGKDPSTWWVDTWQRTKGHNEFLILSQYNATRCHKICHGPVGIFAYTAHVGQGYEDCDHVHILLTVG